MIKNLRLLSLFSLLNLGFSFEIDFRLVDDKVFSNSNNDSYILNSFNGNN